MVTLNAANATDAAGKVVHHGQTLGNSAKDAKHESIRTIRKHLYAEAMKPDEGNRCSTTQDAARSVSNLDTTAITTSENKYKFMTRTYSVPYIYIQNIFSVHTSTHIYIDI